MTPRLVGDEFHRNEEEVATIYGISMSYAGAGASWLSLRHWDWSARTSMTRQSAILPPWHCTTRSEEHTSELQSLKRSSYAVFCLRQNYSLSVLHNLIHVLCINALPANHTE